MTLSEAETVLGQSIFGHPHLTTFGQTNFGRSIFGQNFTSVLVVSQSVRLRSGEAPKGWGPRRGGGPEGVGERRVEVQKVGSPKFRAFFLFRHNFLSFFSLLGSFR